MIVKYYHLRDANSEPRLTRCILKENGGVAVGTSICSYSDFPNKKAGRGRAYSRALSALKHKKHLFPILREEAMEVLVETCADDLDYKGKIKFDREFKGLYFEDVDDLNELEKKLLEKVI